MARSAAPFAFAALLATLGPSRAAAKDAPAPEDVPAAFVAIAAVEHARGDPAGLDPFLAPDADPAARARAVTALGRLGDRQGVVPRLRDLLRRGGPEAEHALWATGLVGSRALVPDVLPYLDRDPKAERDAIVAALGALGRLGDPRADGYAAAFLDAKDSALVLAALDALWRLRAERQLERVLALPDADPAVRRALALAAWQLAAARRAALPPERRAAFDGSALAEGPLLRWARDADAETRLFALRALNALLPRRLEPRAGIPGLLEASLPAARVLLEAVRDADPRVAADAAFRLGGAHTGLDVGDALGAALRSPDSLVRETAADAVAALAARDETSARRALEIAPEDETEARVLAARRRARAATGDADVLAAAVEPNGPVSPEAWREAALLFAAARGPEATDRLAGMLARTDLPAPARVVVLDALAERPADARFVALAARFLADPDPGVRASAAATLARHATGTDAAAAGVAALAAACRPEAGRPDVDTRLAAVSGLGDLATDPKSPAGAVATATEVVRAALADPAPTVRLAAREAAAKIPALAGAARAEDPRPNEWRGLPRPKAPVLGLDLTRGDAWLTEAEVLRLAAEIERRRPVVVLETTRGTIRLEVDAANAPVHAVNLVLCAAAGVYDGTVWHRVVPAFVVQGGDPRGDGSGDAGYAVPDEITPTRFERGVLGMPKSTKDTGGCQLFLMHVAAPHLDGNYTAYGRAVAGSDVIDRLRVGDRILSATVEVPGR